MCNQQQFSIITTTILAATIFISYMGLSNIERLPSSANKNSPGKLSRQETAETPPHIRQQIEEQILQSTVRIEIESWTVRAGEAGYDINVKASHGTVKDGRYLVTHNHFSAAFSGQANTADTAPYQLVQLSNVKGETAFQGPLSEFKVVWEDAETLVIGHEDEGLFGRLGFDSAEFGDGTAVSLQPGMEVAQIDWDGTTTWVEWTTVEAVQYENGVPVLLLDGDIMIGASGGGVFWHGTHIANNWTVRQELDAADVVVGSTTKVALNMGGWE